jgi:hypothetical protein
VADEQSIVGVGRRACPPGQLDGSESHGYEPAVQPGGVVVEQAADQRAPAIDARGRVVECRGVDHGPGPVYEVGHDLQVGGSAVAVGQHCGAGPHQGARQCTEVGIAVGLASVEHRVPAGLDRIVVLREDRAEEPVAAAEVVLERRGVAGTGGAVDLPQADGVDAVGGEQHLGGVDEPFDGCGRLRSGSKRCRRRVRHAH